MVDPGFARKACPGVVRAYLHPDFFPSWPAADLDFERYPSAGDIGKSGRSLFDRVSESFRTHPPQLEHVSVAREIMAKHRQVFVCGDERASTKSVS